MLAHSLFSFQLSIAQKVELPPLLEWHGKSEALIAKPGSKWETPAEKNDFETTPSYTETMGWLDALAKASPFISVTTIGKTAGDFNIVMVRVSKENQFHAGEPTKKPVLLAQAGIHAGEIDGKDAGMMLLRDIVFGGKDTLIDDVNFLFIPILNVDGHERVSPYNRINQRGPNNMGWRTNARNQNLNRDYAKIDTKELRSVLEVINTYNPELYFDIHVTDGADYQYDITYGFIGEWGYSPEISKWLSGKFRPVVDKALTRNGHIPGPLMFAVNGNDFSKGNNDFMFSPDFSHSYGDVRHLPSILIENHSLKPYKQRVLGTYIFLEAALNELATDHKSLEKAIQKDKNANRKEIPLEWTFPDSKPDSMTLLGIQSKEVKSEITGGTYTQWLGKPFSKKIPVLGNTQPAHFVTKPQAYLIPPAYSDIVDRLKAHGIETEVLSRPESLSVDMYRIVKHSFANSAFEGHIKVKTQTKTEQQNRIFPTGTVRVDTNQPLGDLVVLLLEPEFGSSFFQWGFMNGIFSRTEYIESYVMEPYAQKMLDESPELKHEFDALKTDSAFMKNPYAVMEWFYKRTPFYDSEYLLYPIAKEM